MNQTLEDALLENFEPDGSLWKDVRALMELAILETKKECAEIVEAHRSDTILAEMILGKKEGE
jgi:hypothetical protein